MDDAGGSHEPIPREARPGVWVFRDSAELARAAARQFVELASRCIARHGLFTAALSGGRTPRPLYRLLASDELRGRIDWDRLHLFWSDERAVPPDDADSNYGMAHREMLAHVPIPDANVHRMEAERPDIARAAREYETLLRRYLEVDGNGWPRFHLILLGMGADGHTASLFPGETALLVTSRWVATPLVKELGARRMTLTLPVLNAAHCVSFLVAGDEKAGALRNVLEEDGDPTLPARLVEVPAGRRLFLVDRAAANEILSETS